MSTVSMICVADVEATSELLQSLFNWTSAHGGKEFDDLVDKNGRSVLWLHDFDSDDHGRFRGAENKERGVGSSIYVLVDDIDETHLKCTNAPDSSLVFIEALHLNANAKFREFTIKISDGYQFTACEKGPYLNI